MNKKVHIKEIAKYATFWKKLTPFMDLFYKDQAVVFFFFFTNYYIKKQKNIKYKNIFFWNLDNFHGIRKYSLSK